MLAGCQAQKKDEAEAPAAKIEGNNITLGTNSQQLGSLAVAAVTSRQTNALQMTGRLLWNDDVTVRIFSPIGGRVGALTANVGQAVAAGDELARIASPDYGQAQADTRKAAADLVLAERTLNRVKTLFEHGAAAQKDVDAAEGAHASALSEKERASARLALYGGKAEVVDQDFRLKSPIAGLVVERNINANAN